ncbi:MAG: hypothetical protein AB7G28_12315 [Pirellulales bacterium]
MYFSRCAPAVMGLLLVAARPAAAVDYFWQKTAGGAFGTAANWLPAAPAGPGGAADTVNFNLGVAAANRYVVTGVAGQNSRLLARKDTLQLNVGDYTLTSAGVASPGFVAGVLSGDLGDVILNGPAASVLHTDASSLGLVAGSSGVATVDAMQWIGTGSQRVGEAGVGSMFIRNGADVTQGSITLGHATGSGGTATVQDNGSTWNTAGELIVGRQGGGFVAIQTGGDVTSGSATLGSLTGSTGTAIVNGEGSSLTATGSLVVGSAGDGSMLVQVGGDVVSGNSYIARLAGGEGTASVSGAGSTWNVNGRLSVGGDSGAGVPGGAGTLDVMAGGSVTVTSDITVFPMGQARLAGGTLLAGEIRFQGAGGQFGWTSGTLQLGAYHGSLVNAAGLLEARGLISTVTIDNNYTQQGSGTLRVGIGGPTPNTSYDVVNVGGTAAVDGLLEIQQVAGFVPMPNQTFTVLNAASISGAFDNVANGQRLQITGGATSGSFVVNYGTGSAFDPKRIVLSAFQLTGDYNFDGIVNAADYSIWRDTLGSTTDLRANGNNTGASAGVIDAADFDAWKTNFGKKATGLGAGALDVAAVPEPTLGALLAVASACLAGFRSSRRQHLPI